MSLYCICAPRVGGIKMNRILNPGDDPYSHQVVLNERMRCIKTGAEQFIDHGQAGFSKHYPNVDLFECPNCGSCVARE